MRTTYTVDRIPDKHALWRPRSRAAAIERARVASGDYEGRFAAWAFHPIDVGYRRGECIAVFEKGKKL